MGKKQLTQEEFINECVENHGDLYDLSKAVYIKSTEKVLIGCKIHGDFEILPYNIRKGNGCPKCSRRMTQDEFILKAKSTHGDLYDYTNTVFEGSARKVTITCKVHGDFEQNAGQHILGKGCSLCGNNQYTQEQIISILEEKHPTLDFSKVLYKNTKEKVPVSCKICEHNFTPSIGNLKDLNSGCPKCANNITKTTEEFIKESKESFLDRFDYTKTNYTKAHDTVIIHCNKHDIDFEIPAFHHLNGRGCHLCNTENNSFYAVKNIEEQLNSLGIEFIKEKRFSDCRNVLPLPFDFYIESMNLCIEYDGIQHFKALSHWGGEETLEMRKINDEIKNQYCKDNNINLLRLRYNEPYIKTLLKYLENFK